MAAAARWTTTCTRLFLSTGKIPWGGSSVVARHLPVVSSASSSSSSNSSTFRCCRFFATSHTTIKNETVSDHANAKKKNDDDDDYAGDSGDDSDWDDDIVLFDEDSDTEADTTDLKSIAVVEKEDQPPKRKTNAALQSVIDSGLDELKAASTLISSKKETRKPLFHKGALDGADLGPTKQQLTEANRVLSAATRCMEALYQRNKKGKHRLEIGGFSILLVHVEVNANLKEATIYWALPFEILLEADERTRQDLTERMQYEIVEGGGGRFLQREVHRVLSHYYPPKLKFKPASDVLLQQMLDFS